MNYDVIIAGGGPTGLWLACELALARVRVVVIENLAEPTGHSKALGLQSRSMEMLEYRGLLDRFTAGNTAPLSSISRCFPWTCGGLISRIRMASLSRRHGSIKWLEVVAGDDVAFAFAHMQCIDPTEKEQRKPLDFRLTVGLRRVEGRWIIIHEHHSVPAN